MRLLSRKSGPTGPDVIRQTLVCGSPPHLAFLAPLIPTRVRSAGTAETAESRTIMITENMRRFRGTFQAWKPVRSAGRPKGQNDRVRFGTARTVILPLRWAEPITAEARSETTWITCMSSNHIEILPPLPRNHTVLRNQLITFPSPCRPCHVVGAPGGLHPSHGRSIRAFRPTHTSPQIPQICRSANHSSHISCKSRPRWRAKCERSENKHSWCGSFCLADRKAQGQF